MSNDSIISYLRIVIRTIKENQKGGLMKKFGTILLVIGLLTGLLMVPGTVSSVSPSHTETLTIDTGTNFDAWIWQSDGPIEGSTSWDPAVPVAAVTAVTVEVRAQDVDSGSGEVDEVRLNGEHIGDLVGVSDDWSITTFALTGAQISAIFDSAVYPLLLESQILVDVATVGDVWVVWVDWVTIEIEYDYMTGVFPAEVIQTLEPGASFNVTKDVVVPGIPPNPDIYFLADITGSMDPAIAAVQASVGSIVTAILAVQPTAQFGVGSYRDYPYDALPPFYHQLSITADTTAVATAIGTWAAGGGSDGPEAQFYALNRLADPADSVGIGWRGGPNKIVVWFGDAPAHDPVPDLATGLGYDIDEASVTADLVAAGIKVIAISLNSGGYPAGIDDDPNVGGGDYAGFYLIVENGNPGQATNIAAATGGAYLFAATPEEAADAVVTGIEELTTDVWWEVTADDGLTVTLSPDVYYGVSGPTVVSFTETIAVDLDAPQCDTTLFATVTFIANSYPETGETIGVQRIAITVPDVTPPAIACLESVNPHGNNTPPAGSTTLPGPKGGQNEDGFYQLLAEDNCDEPDEIAIFVADASGFIAGPFSSGDVVKITEDPTVPQESKKIGRSWPLIPSSMPLIPVVTWQGPFVWCHLYLSR
jgi:hypothetical protein